MYTLHIYLSPFRYQSRVLKECHATMLRWPDGRISLAGLWEPGLERHEEIRPGVDVWRARIALRSWPRNTFVQLLKYGEWVLRVLKRFRGENLTIVHAHSMPALGVAVLLKWATKAAVVYDAHELESKKSSKSKARQRLAARAEKLLIRYADKVVVVGDKIADWYAAHYRIPRPIVVRNVPDESLQASGAVESKAIRRRCSISDEDIVFLYQGALSRQRAIPRFLDVFARAGGDRHVVFMGYGATTSLVNDYAKRHANIHYIPPVPPDELLQYTAGADVGICGMGEDSLSYKLSLPNKFFEYLFANLPVLIGDRPEQKEIVERFNCGWCVGPDDAQFVSLIDGMDKESIAERKRGAAGVREQYKWSGEVEKLLDAYDEVLGA